MVDFKNTYTCIILNSGNGKHVASGGLPPPALLSQLPSRDKRRDPSDANDVNIYIYICYHSWNAETEKDRNRKMGGMAAAMIVAASILMGCADLALGLNEAGKIHVGGKVLCQDCTQGWNDWAYHGKPIKGTYIF